MITCTDEESWLKARREERESEFAPPQIYTSDSTSVPHTRQWQRPANRQPQKRSLFGYEPRPQLDAESRTGPDVRSSADNVAAVLQSIRSSVEQSDNITDNICNKTALTIGDQSFSLAQNSVINFTTPPFCHSADVSVNEALYSVSFDNQMISSSWTGPSLSSDQFLSMENVQGPNYGSLQPPSSNISDTPSADLAASLPLSEAGITTGSFGVSFDNPGPQPAHYCSAPSAPQAKMPKYERIFLHDLPPTLPLPPVVGSSNAQYPSQEEVIGPSRRKEPHEMSEKDAIRNWHRQFEQKRAKPVATASVESGEQAQLLKPRNIPFASPYIQTNDASSKVADDTAAKEFDPSKPPPSAGSSGS